jgi:hypothetical protein
LYPRKEGKASGMKKLAKMSESDLELVLKAVRNYKNKLSLENTPKHYTLLFSTFVNGRWEDYLDLDVNAPTVEYLKYLEPLGLKHRFAKYIDRFADNWKSEDQFLNHLTNLRTYYIRTNEVDSVNPESESFRGFIAVCLSKDLGI